MKQLDLPALLEVQREFVRERQWQRFHTPKNLSMALAGEAAELLELFQWLSAAESRQIMRDPAKATAVSHELADIFYYLLRLADVLDVDLQAAFTEKMVHNRKKYPLQLAKGSAKKYHELLRAKGLHRR
jgi:NTP pyrophosphatase (non-canonical NTP hydrolase)